MSVLKRAKLDQYRKSLCRVLRYCDNAGGSLMIQWVVCMLSITEEMIDGKRKVIDLEYAQASYNLLRAIVEMEKMYNNGGFATLAEDAYQLFK